jgi:hypothetical protein
MWIQIANAILRIWLIAAPSVLGNGGAARTNELIVGPIAARFAIIAISDVCRSWGKVNLISGLWLLLAPWMLGYAHFAAIIACSAAGALMCLLSAITGTPQGSYGGGWSFVFTGVDPSEKPEA